jgi:hypothetical protein
MSIEQTIQEAFFPDGSVPIEDEFIESNPDIAWLNEKVDLLSLVPCYMLWCARNRDANGNLVIDGTVNALAEYGRSKNLKLDHLNFKYLCTSTQKEVVLKFLQWCLTEELLGNEEQVRRTCKNWG